MKTAQTKALMRIVKNDQIARVRELNDAMRRDLFNPTLGTLIFTPYVAALMDSDRFALLDEVRCFEDFGENNDPYHEHDFGKVSLHGENYFWKID
jgi:hypothetical protein